MIVVTGATGNIGRPLVAALTAAGEKVRAVSRHASTASDSPPNLSHLRADLADARTLGPAFDGADTLFLLLAGGLLDGATPPGPILDAAKAGGVSRIVLLSSQILGTRPDADTHEPMRVFETAVRNSVPRWTILRSGGLASNAYAWVDSVRKDRVVAAPFGNVALPVIDPHDIADVAAGVLRDETHSGRIHTLTGPAAVTPREQAAAIGAAIGADVRFVELTREQAGAHFSRFMPGPVVEGTLDVLGKPLPAEQQVSPDVAELLGRDGRTFAGWARRNAPAFT